jgi:hypothetical protein
MAGLFRFTQIESMDEFGQEFQEWELVNENLWAIWLRLAWSRTRQWLASSQGLPLARQNG